MSDTGELTLDQFREAQINGNLADTVHQSFLNQFELFGWIIVDRSDPSTAHYYGSSLEEGDIVSFSSSSNIQHNLPPTTNPEAIYGTDIKLSATGFFNFIDQSQVDISLRSKNSEGRIVFRSALEPKILSDIASAYSTFNLQVEDNRVEKNILRNQRNNLIASKENGADELEIWKIEQKIDLLTPSFTTILLQQHLGDSWKDQLTHVNIEPRSIRHLIENMFTTVYSAAEIRKSYGRELANMGSDLLIAASRFEVIGNILQIIDKAIQGKSIRLVDGIDVLHRVGKDLNMQMDVPPKNRLDGLIDARFILDSIDLLDNAKKVQREDGMAPKMKIVVRPDHIAIDDNGKLINGTLISFLNNGKPLHESMPRENFQTLFNPNTGRKGHGNGLFYWRNTVNSLGGYAEITSPPIEEYVIEGYVTGIHAFFPNDETGK